MSPEALQGHLQAARAKNKPMLVRVATGDVNVIKPALDAGVEAIIVPMMASTPASSAGLITFTSPVATRTSMRVFARACRWPCSAELIRQY